MPFVPTQRDGIPLCPASSNHEIDLSNALPSQTLRSESVRQLHLRRIIAWYPAYVRGANDLADCSHLKDTRLLYFSSLIHHVIANSVSILLEQTLTSLLFSRRQAMNPLGLHVHNVPISLGTILLILSCEYNFVDAWKERLLIRVHLQHQDFILDGSRNR